MINLVNFDLWRYHHGPCALVWLTRLFLRWLNIESLHFGHNFIFIIQNCFEVFRSCLLDPVAERLDIFLEPNRLLVFVLRGSILSRRVFMLDRRVNKPLAKHLLPALHHYGRGRLHHEIRMALHGTPSLQELEIDITVGCFRPHHEILSVLEDIPIVVHLLLPLSDALSLLLAVSPVVNPRRPSSTLRIWRIVSAASPHLIVGLVTAPLDPVVRGIQGTKLIVKLLFFLIMEILLCTVDGCLDVDFRDPDLLGGINWRHGAAIVSNGWNCVQVQTLYGPHIHPWLVESKQLRVVRKRHYVVLRGSVFFERLIIALNRKKLRSWLIIRIRAMLNHHPMT